MNTHCVKILAVVILALAIVPTCLACPVDPFVALASAGPSQWAMLGLGGVKVQETNDTINSPTGGPWAALQSVIQGNVGVAPDGDFKMSGDGIVTGTVYMNSAGQYSVTGSSQVLGTPAMVVVPAAAPNILSVAVNDAMAAYSAAKALASTHDLVASSGLAINHLTTYSSISGGTPAHPYTLTGQAGLNVINLNNLILEHDGSGSLYLNALNPSSTTPTKFVIDISGTFSISSGADIVLGAGVLPENVLFNVINTAPTTHIPTDPSSCTSTGVTCVNFAGGHESSGAVASNVAGIILAPYRDINMAPTNLTGEVIGGGNFINIASGSSIFATEAVPEPTSLLLLSSGLAMLGLRRRQRGAPDSSRR